MTYLGLILDCSCSCQINKCINKQKKKYQTDLSLIQSKKGVTKGRFYSILVQNIFW